MKSLPGKRVLMLLENNCFPQDVRVRNEANALTEAGYQVSVICPTRPGMAKRELVKGVAVYRFAQPPEANGLVGYLWEYGYSMLAAFVLSLVVYFERGFDIIHAHNPPDTFVTLAALYKLLGKQFVFDHHDLAPEMYFARFGGVGNRRVHSMLLFFEKLSCRLADQVIATNQSYRQLQIERDGVPASRITVVRNGPDLERFRPVAVDPALQRAGKTTLCYVGEMGFHDGVDYLLRALNKLIYELGREDVYCLLVGAGDAWPSLRALATELKLDNYVNFTGRVKPDEVVRYLSAADICIAPEPSNSYNDRSTMIKIAEYMAMSKPIVAFDLPEHRVTAQGAALYASANNVLELARQMVRLMDDPTMRQQMGKAGRERVETALAWPFQARELVRAYEQLSFRTLRHPSVRQEQNV